MYRVERGICMEKKISLKTLYLIAVIAIGLVVLGFGSTYALFTASASIANPIYIASNLSYNSDIMETVDVTISPGETEYVILDVNNTSTSSLNYVAWYINEGKNIDLGVEFNETAESLGCNTVCSNVPSSTTGIEIRIYMRNNESSTVTFTIGVSSSSSDVILANNMEIIPNQEMPPPTTPLSDFMYVLGSNNTTYNIIDYYDSNTDTIVDGNLVEPITIESNEILLTRYIGQSTTVVVPDTYTVGGVIYNTVVLSCGTITIGNETAQIRTGAFLNDSYITNVIFKDNVKTLSYDYYNSDAYKSAAYLFENCTSLVNVRNIPDSVDFMYYTFTGCSSLENAPELPASLINMTYTFSGCSKLSGEINILASNITSVVYISGAFDGTTLPITVNVPAGSSTFNSFNTSGCLPSNVSLVGV